MDPIRQVVEAAHALSEEPLIEGMQVSPYLIIGNGLVIRRRPKSVEEWLQRVAESEAAESTPPAEEK